MSKNKKIILSSFFLALHLVLSRFLSIETEILVISFGFVPTMLSAIFLGPKYSTLIAALADFLGAMLFPFGAYFPGFTLSSAISGLIYGILLYEPENCKRSSKNMLIRLIVSSGLSILLVNTLLNSLWLNIMYGKAYIALLYSRILKQLIMFPIQVLTVYGLYTFLKPIVYKYLIEGDLHDKA